MLETFLRMSVATFRAIPVINYVRMSYGIVVLPKPFVASTTKTNPVGKLVDHESLEVPQHFEQLLARLMAAAKGGKC
jgi:hypothetical protein